MIAYRHQSAGDHPTWRLHRIEVMDSRRRWSDDRALLLETAIMSSRITRTAARSITPGLVLGCIALAVLSACNRGDEQIAATSATEPAELTWARSALERNPRYEVLASDIQARVFTVRDRSSGEVETINLNDLAAAPVSQLRAAPPA